MTPVANATYFAAGQVVEGPFFECRCHAVCDGVADAEGNRVAWADPAVGQLNYVSWAELPARLKSYRRGHRPLPSSPAAAPRCTCGSRATYGDGGPHTDYCDLTAGGAA